VRELILAACLIGCVAPEPEPEPVIWEPLDAPADLSLPGAPVGARTVTFEDQTFEVWYPASDGVLGSAGQSIDVGEFVPEVFTERVGAFELPALPSVAVRGVPARLLPSPVPALLFSHGFGGFRTQSATLCAHLASRGYVVIAADHPGRMLGDVLPCLFEPALEGCDLAAFAGGDDPAIDDMLAARRWVEQLPDDSASFIADIIDPERIGILGHSMGGATAMELGSLDSKLDAILSMASPASSDTDKPTAVFGGSCDPFADPSDLQGVLDGLGDGVWVDILDAGHMTFSDLCPVDLGELADNLLVDRPDIDAGFLDNMLDLVTSGCSGYTPPEEPACGPEFLPLDQAEPIIEAYATAFFDAALTETGPGIQAGLFDDAEVTR
jgi:dienelactone hydrolase